MEPDFVQLVGMKCWGWGRAADLASFQIGTQRTVIDHQGKAKTVGQFALHIQCSWRIVQPGRVIVASGDLYYTPDGHAPGPDFDWEPRGANRRDVNLDHLFSDDQQLVVRDVKLECAGFLRIMFANNVCLEVFPDSSLDQEQWRLFQPYTGRPHMVACGGSVREDAD
jgi:hypothetical protein